MEMMIERSSRSAARIFPNPAPDLYQLGSRAAGLTPDERAARQLLSWGEQDVGPKLRWRRGQPSHQEKVARLFFYHRQALAEELAGQTERADFFWRELHSAFNALWHQLTLWSEVGQTITDGVTDGAAASSLHEPATLRQRVANEILIDTHCALYNGWLQATDPITPQARLWAHYSYLSQLLALPGLSDADSRNVLEPSAALLIKLCRETPDWGRAIEAAQVLVKHFPDSDEKQDQLAELYFSSTLAQLTNGESEADSMLDAKKLKRGTEQLDALRNAHPDNSTLFQLLGQLHHIRAIKLANGGDIVEALAAIQRSVMFYPISANAAETRERLIELMKQLQAQVGEMEQVVAEQGLKINSQGRQLQHQAQRGYGLMNEYAESEEARQVIEQFYLLHARQLWRTIGLALPAAEADANAVELLNAVNFCLDQAPATEAEIAPLWLAVTQQNPRMAELDATAICAFLQKQLFSPEPVQTEMPTETSAPGASNATGEIQPTPGNPFILPVAPRAAKQRGEPFVYWLLSRQNLGLKAVAATALLVLSLAAGLAWRESSYRQTRDLAYRQLITAKEQQQWLPLVEGAEDFLAHPPLNGADGRESKVLDYYQEALVQWALKQAGQDDSVLSQHLARYRQLAANNQ